MPLRQLLRVLLLTSSLLGLMLPSAASAQGADTVSLSFSAPSTWTNGFQGEVTLTNNASWAIPDWTLSFDLPHTITSIWDASIASHTGTQYTLKAVQESWEDGDLSPGESKTIGFVASTTGSVSLPVTGTLNGAPVLMNGTSPAPAPPELVPAPHWPARVFAPYVDATGWPPFDYVTTMQDQGVRFFNLAFVVAASATDGTPSWGGYYDVSSGYLLSEVNQIRALGGDVMVSFGGAAGTELAGAHTSVASLQAAYQSVIDAYQLTHIDFDIEGSWVAHPSSIQRRSEAIAGLQAAAVASGNALDIWYTLPVLPTGLTPDGVNVVQSAITEGVSLSGVNIMTMDYGPFAAPNPAGQMGSYAIQAATSLFNQLTALYAQNGIVKSSEEIWAMVGVTPMIGQNDVLGEIFLPSDATQVLAFANQQKIGFLSFWSATRDLQCPEGVSTSASATCSGILQSPFEFTQIFLPFSNVDWTDLGQALAGAHGKPALVANGTLMNNSSLVMSLSNAPPSSFLWIVGGATQVNWPAAGGILVPSPDVILGAVTTPLGEMAYGLMWPANVPAGFTVHLQCFVQDPTGPQAYSISNAVRGVVP
jgi:hypothetical protein